MQTVKEALNRWIDDRREDMIADVAALVAVPSLETEPVGDLPYGENVEKA